MELYIEYRLNVQIQNYLDSFLYACLGINVYGVVLEEERELLDIFSFLLLNLHIYKVMCSFWVFFVFLVFFKQVKNWENVLRKENGIEYNGDNWE